MSGNVPLVEVCRQEIHHLAPAISIRSRMKMLSSAYDFTVMFEYLSEKMRNSALACRDKNVDLTRFAEQPSTALLCIRRSSCEDGRYSSTTIDVGGINKPIYGQVRGRAPFALPREDWDNSRR